MSLLCARRTLRAVDHERRRVSVNDLLRDAKKAWHGVKLHEPDWGGNSHTLAVSGEISSQGLGFYLLLNGYWDPLDFELPPLKDDQTWRRWIDTGLDAPHDITPWQEAQSISGTHYHAAPRSVVMLFAGNAK